MLNKVGCLRHAHKERERDNIKSSNIIYTHSQIIKTEDSSHWVTDTLNLKSSQRRTKIHAVTQMQSQELHSCTPLYIGPTHKQRASTSWEETDHLKKHELPNWFSNAVTMHPCPCTHRGRGPHGYKFEQMQPSHPHICHPKRSSINNQGSAALKFHRFIF